MSSTTSPSSSSAFATPTGQFDGGTANGIGAGVYYAAIGVAVAIIASITLLSRILYARKLKALQRRRTQAERSAMDRRGEAPGLPTYVQSRMEGRTVDANYDLAPPDTPPPEDRPTGWNTWVWSHMPTITLPAALHLRREDRDHELPAYAPNAPPKYDDISTPGLAAPVTAATSSTEPAAGVQVPVLRRESESTTHGPPTVSPSARVPPPPLPADEQTHVIGAAEGEDDDFIHPEERRRRDLDRAAGVV